MSKSYRIRTQPGIDKSIQIKLDQDFEFLEILSLKLTQSEIYTRVCSDYGVIVGRVLVNGGYGLPNVKVSVFIPISEEDQLDPIISELYPYTSLDVLNVDGYRYNLLPYKPSYIGHASTGTFPEREDVLIDSSLIEVYDKYYKFTVKTNESGDYMIFGVPTGEHTVVMDVDLSDIGCFSLTPQDLINSGLATESQVNGNRFKSSTNLNELPQIITLNKTIEVSPLWGEPEICLLGITRTDFDLTSSANINIQPTAVFMGSIVSTADEDSIKTNCKPKPDTGNMCDLIAGPGQILSIRQTINVDKNGDPILESFTLEQDGKVIDENGTWLINVPMNLDYITTNEFGEQVLSNDPKIGIPTKGNYRFKVKWQNDGGLQSNFLRGNYLVPNIKEHGWSTSLIDPFDPDNTSTYNFVIPVGLTATTIYNVPSGGLVFDNKTNSNQFSVLINGSPYYGDITSIPVNNGDDVTIISNPIDDTQPQNIYFTFLPEDYFNLLRSYTFSLDWDDYVDKQSAINCEDTFYSFNYNKVYTVASFIDRYKNGKNRSRHLGIKEITDRSCQSENNKFPVNDIQRNFDAIAFVVNILLQVLTLPIIALITVIHIVYRLWPFMIVLLKILLPALIIWNIVTAGIALAGAIANGITLILAISLGTNLLIWIAALSLILFVTKDIKLSDRKKKFARIGLPMMTYPDCELCPCKDKQTQLEEIETQALEDQLGEYQINTSFLADVNMSSSYSGPNGDSNYGPYHDLIANDDPDVAGLAITNFRQIFSGVDNDNTNYNGSCSFLTKKEFGSDEYGYPLTETFPQKLNSFNLRDKYFQQTNIIETNVNGSGIFNDQIMVVLVDPGMIDNFLSGDIVTFQDPNLSGDITRITGLTTENQFGNNSITGVTTTGITIPKLITYANPNDTTYSSNLTTTVLINQTNNDGSYRFPIDMEYFQVVTGLTVQDFIDVSQSIGGLTSSNKFPNEYLRHKIRIRTHKYDNSNPSFPSPGPNPDIYESQTIAIEQFTDYQNLGVLMFVRGVDPYTDRQNIEYNLTKIFGGNSFSTGTQIKVNGDFKMNYPIRGYSNGTKPAIHNTLNNQPSFGLTSGIYNPSFTYNVDITLFNTYVNSNSKLPYYYLSTDSTNSGLLFTLPSGSISTSSTIDDIAGTNGCKLLPYKNIANNLPLYNYTQNYYPYYVGGGSFLMCSVSVPRYDLDCDNSDNFSNNVIWELYTPSYIKYGLTGVNFNNPNGMVMRSDRLPVSTTLDDIGTYYGAFALHQNKKFPYFLIPDDGLSEQGALDNIFTSETNGFITDNFNNSFPLTVTDTLSCDGIVELKCYDGYGTGMTIDQTCVNTDKVEAGCYYLINKDSNGKYINEIPNDIKLFLEWKMRFIINYSSCRGVFGHMFQNNWINGVLYKPSFNKTTTFNINGDPKYNYCQDIVVFNQIDKNFYYRSSPYDGTNFIGMRRDNDSINDGSNNTQILFPTTIMDLGNRDFFINQICSSSEFQGRYLANTLNHTSYNDSSDVLLFGILSRILNSNWWNQLLQINNGSIAQFFDSRTGTRIDGDIAQSFSINSEYQINPFINGNYLDNHVFLGQSNNKPVFGVFYDLGETDEKYKNRRSLSPGYYIYNVNPLLQNYFGYPGTQEVPLYKWKLNTTTTIFGDEKNNWLTTSNQNITGDGFYSRKYQDLDASSDPYFSTPLSNPNFGFITNFDSSGNPVVSSTINEQQFLVGAPNYFYFGLKQGGSALNRFIKLYIDTNE